MFDWIFFILTGKKDIHIRPDPPTAELAALERLNVLTTLAPSFLNRFPSFLQVTRKSIKSWISWNFGQIRRLTVELAVPTKCFRCRCFVS